MLGTSEKMKKRRTLVPSFRSLQVPGTSESLGTWEGHCTSIFFGMLVLGCCYCFVIEIILYILSYRDLWYFKNCGRTHLTILKCIIQWC